MRAAGTRPDARPGPSGRREIAGVGRVCFWDGGSLWIGRRGGQTQPHAHHAIQVTVALDDDGFGLRGGPDRAWSSLQAAVVTPHCRHQFDGRGASIAHLFVEPETAAGRALLERFGAGCISELPSDEAGRLGAALGSCYGALTGGAMPRADGEASLVATARQVIASLAGVGEPAAPIDPRVARAIAKVRSGLADPVTLAEAAAAAHLSPSRFRHLIVAQTGATFRAHVLWLRINAAVQAATAGRSWTEAAHEAGFADSAHLSRTFRRVFGIVPAMLVRE